MSSSDPKSLSGHGGVGRGWGSEMCYVHVLVPHNQCNHYTLQTCSNKIFFKNMLQIGINQKKGKT